MSIRLFLYLFWLSLFSCTLAFGQEARVYEPIRVGMYENPPKIFTNPAGNVVGIFPDILNHIAKEEGWQITYVPGSWQQCMERLAAGKLDMMVDVAFSAERAKRFDFSAETIFVNYGTIYSRPNLKINSLLDLDGRSIAVMKGSIHTVGPSGIKNQLRRFAINNTRFIEVDDYKSVFSLVGNNQADAGVVNRLFGSLYHEQYGVQASPVIFNPRQLRFAFPKNSVLTPLLKERIDHRIRSMKQDPSSFFHKVLSSYLSGLPEPWTFVRKSEESEKTTIPLTPKEKAWIAKHPVIRVASDPFWEPLEYLDDKGNYNGIVIDYLHRIEEILGIRLQVVEDKSWQALVEMSKRKEIDMFSCVTQTAERSQYLAFTKPYLTFPIVIFTMENVSYINNLKELSGERVAIVGNYAIHEILRRNHPDLQLVPVQNVREGIAALQNGKAAAFIGNLLTTSHYISSQGIHKIKVGGETPYKNKLSMAVRSDWPELVGILQKGLDSMSDGEKNALFRKWVPLSYEHSFDYTLLWKTLAVFSIVFLLFLFWNRRLSREIANRKTAQRELTNYKDHLEELVDKRTSELNSSNEQLKQEIAERIQTEEALKMDEDRLEALLRLSQLDEISEKGIIDFGLEEGVRLTDSKFGYFHLINEDHINLEFFTWSREALKNCSAPHNMHSVNEAGIWADSIRRGKTVIHNDYAGEPGKKGYPEGHVPIERHMSVPIFVKEEMVAIFGVGNKLNPYNESDARQLTLLGQGVWAMIRRQREEEQRKNLEKQLRQSQKIKSIGVLAGGIAHDFNNILTAIIGYAELVHTQLPEGSPANSDQQQVLTAAHRAKDLVRQILAFSRQSEGQLKPIHPHLILKEALRLLRSSIPATIEIRQDIDDSCTILADPTQIHQIIMNLCTNAYQAMRETGGTLLVSLKPVEVRKEDDKVFSYKLMPGRYMHLTVSDTGCGMDEKTQEKIFEPYFTTKKTGEGSGLGLSVVHGIVENYGGSILVSSKPLTGSTFEIYLPCLESLADLPEAPQTAPAPIGGSERILILDDDASIVRLLELMLTNLGYEVLPFTIATEALAAMEQRAQEIDAVITDMTMPVMTGVEFSRHCFEIKPDIPIILCTGFSELINEEQAKALGIREFIMKPVIHHELAAAIRRILDTAA